MAAPYQRLIETTVGPAFVRVTGDGPKVFVIHGGPGFDHRYLQSAVGQLAQRRTMIFFDQPGCGKSPAPEEGTTGEATFKLFAELRSAIAGDEPIGVLAHSWGAVVAVASSADDGFTPITEGLLVTPMPLTNREYDVCRENLFRRVPPETASQFETLVAEGADGEVIVELLLPYYLGQNTHARVTGLHFEMATFGAVMQSISGFDFTPLVGNLGRFQVLIGGADFTTSDLVEELTGAAQRTHFMSGVGHFPFYEDAAAFDAILAQAFPD